MKIISLYFVFFWILFKASGQVSLAPTTVFADNNGIGTLYVTNSSDNPQEVVVSFLFGYLGNDSLGNALMVYNDSLREIQSGLGDRIRTFPRSFILAAGQQQTVRFQVRPDKTKPAGMYFTRVKVSSVAVTQDVENANVQGIATQVNLRYDQIIAAFYKSGDVYTGLEFDSLEGSRKENSILISSQFKVIGNSPFLGSLHVEIKDETGKIVANHQQTVALYYGGKRNYTIPLPESIESGTYQLQLIFKTERSDIPSTDLVQSAPITNKLKVVL